MEYFNLTKEMILLAQTYMPLEDKIEHARSIALACVKPMKTAEQNKPADKLISLPMICEEDYALKSILLMVTLLGFYFDIEFDEGGDPYTAYNYYAGGHLMNQIERFKGDRDTKDIAFDILEDFREFKKMVDTMIFCEKANANDPLGRLGATIELLSTPENIQTLVDALQKTGEKVREAQILRAILNPEPTVEEKA